MSSRAPLWVTVGFLVLGAAWLRLTEVASADFPPGCSLDQTGQGLSQARAYLGGPGGHELRLLTTVLHQADLPTTAVLLRIAPQSEPVLTQTHDPDDLPRARSLLSAEEQQWVEAGGRLVLAISEAYGPVQVGSADPAERSYKVFPALPGVQHVAFLRPLRGAVLAGGCTILACGAQPGVVRILQGRGEVWILSCPEAFYNHDLAHLDHLALLLGLVAGRSTVYLDEFAHGVREELGFFSLARHAHLGPAMALLALSGGLWFYRRRVLIGEPTRHGLPPSAEAVEGVLAISALYARALGRRESLTTHYHRLLRQLQERHPGMPALAQSEADRLLDRWRPEQLLQEPSPVAFRSLLRRLNRAFRSLHDHHRRRP